MSVVSTPPPRAGLRIGLTGGIGSGKSTVARLLAQHGAILIDADAISRALTLPGGAAIEALRTAFGDPLIDAAGGMDRRVMRELVFSDATAKSRLEAIIHPLIKLECARQENAAAGHPVVFDVPLLVESPGWRARVDRVLVVDCSEDLQVRRVMQRSGWAGDTVAVVIAQQATRSARRAAADAVIFNEHLSLTELAHEVSALWRHWYPVEQSA